jgi:hypothetical protein
MNRDRQGSPLKPPREEDDKKPRRRVLRGGQTWSGKFKAERSPEKERPSALRNHGERPRRSPERPQETSPRHVAWADENEDSMVEHSAEDRSPSPMPGRPSPSPLPRKGGQRNDKGKGKGGKKGGKGKRR